MNGLFRRPLGLVAMLAATFGVTNRVQSTQPTVQTQTVPGIPASQGVTNDPLAIHKGASREHAARIGFTRNYRAPDSPIWIGRPRSRYGATWRWNRP